MGPSPLDAVGIDAIRRMKRDEYDRLVELGVFEGEHAELLWGVIVTMSPISAAHNWCVQEMARALFRGVGDEWTVRVQGSFAASDDSEPEPDIAVVPTSDAWRHRHPDTAALVVEVAASSLKRDRAKADLYAAANVPEYWLVDLEQGMVEVHTEPANARYRTKVTRGRGESLVSRILPGVRLRVDDILP